MGAPVSHWKKPSSHAGGAQFGIIPRFERGESLTSSLSTFHHQQLSRLLGHARLTLMPCTLRASAVLLFLFVSVSCKSQPAMGPRSLEALLPQLPKRIAEGQPEELCEFIREKPQGSDAITLHDNDLTESNLPQSYNGLTSLSRIVTHLLLSGVAKTSTELSITGRPT